MREKPVLRGQNKHEQELIEEARALGYRAYRRGSHHLCFRHPDRRIPPVFTGSTPSDSRSTKNGVKSLHRFVRLAGL